MRTILTLFLVSIFLTPLFSQAQMVNFQPNIAIETTPFFPEPNTETEISLDAYTIDTTGASITWFVDGVEKTDAKNKRSFNLTTKEAGEETNVSVELQLFSGQTFTDSITINPVRIDMVIEADTTVPAFYKGRPLPSAGSLVRVIATPYTGQAINPRELTYQWKHNNKMLFGGPIKGGQIAEIEAGMGKEQIVTVDVINSRNETIASKSVILPLAETEVLFYEENPLKGASQVAVGENYFMNTENVTFRAEPYFMDREIFTLDPLLEWKINGNKVENPSTNPQYLTLEKNRSGGSATINFHIRNLQQLLQGVRSEFTVNF